MLTVDVVEKYNDPFPHAVLKHNAAEMPPRPDWRLLAIGKGENIRSDWQAKHLIRSPHVHQAWKDEAIRWTSRQKWLEFYVPLFGDDIRRTYPDLEARMGAKMEDWRIGMRYEDRDIDVGLEFQIGINTPLTVAGSVKGPHVDSVDELIGGLLYMRDPEDTSTGGELEIYAADNPRFHGKRIVVPESRVDLVRTIPYKDDTGAVFVNSRSAVHGVSPRSPSPIPRRLISICADLRLLLFKVDR